MGRGRGKRSTIMTMSSGEIIVNHVFYNHFTYGKKNLNIIKKLIFVMNYK